MFLFGFSLVQDASHIFPLFGRNGYKHGSGEPALLIGPEN